MGVITIPKKKAEVPPPAELLSDMAAEIDLVGELTEKAEPIVKQIKALQAQLKPLKDAEKALQAKLDDLEFDPDAEGQVERGARYQVTVGKMGTSRSIKDLALVKKEMGEALFMQVASVTLKDIDAYLTLPQRDHVLAYDRTSRSYKVAKRAGA